MRWESHSIATHFLLNKLFLSFVVQKHVQRSLRWNFHCSFSFNKLIWFATHEFQYGIIPNALKCSKWMLKWLHRVGQHWSWTMLMLKSIPCCANAKIDPWLCYLVPQAIPGCNRSWMPNYINPTNLAKIDPSRSWWILPKSMAVLDAKIDGGARCQNRWRRLMQKLMAVLDVKIYPSTRCQNWFDRCSMMKSIPTVHGHVALELMDSMLRARSPS